MKHPAMCIALLVPHLFNLIGIEAGFLIFIMNTAVKSPGTKR